MVGVVAADHSLADSARAGIRLRFAFPIAKNVLILLEALRFGRDATVWAFHL
jgi:hypothetical protein